MASLGQCQPVLDGFARHTCQPSASANETQPCVGLWGQRGVAEGGLSLVIDQKWLERWPGSDLSCCWTMLDRLDHSEPLTDARMLHRNSTPVGAAATQTANGIRPRSDATRVVGSISLSPKSMRRPWQDFKVLSLDRYSISCHWAVLGAHLETCLGRRCGRDRRTFDRFQTLKTPRLSSLAIPTIAHARSLDLELSLTSPETLNMDPETLGPRPPGVEAANTTQTRISENWPNMYTSSRRLGPGRL